MQKTCTRRSVTYAFVIAIRSPAMPSPTQPSSIPDDRLTVQKRDDGAVVVRVQSTGDTRDRLPDAVFSFRCGDPQYAYWLARCEGR